MTTTPRTVGFLHPGAMGSTIGATATVTRKVWAGDGRSAETRARADAATLEDIDTVAAMAETADVIVSVCPPGSALGQAAAVAAAGFSGVYVDANAVSPDTARAIGAHFDRFVDGGIVGPPAVRAGTTRLYLAGPEAAAVAELWDDSVLEVRIVDGAAGAASAVKMAFAAWTKGTSALLLAINALAEAEGVRADLAGEWQTSMPDLVTRSHHTPAGVGPKAWRFGPEMEEIAATFEAAGLPSGFHEAAAETYRRLAPFRSTDPPPDLDAVIAALLGTD